MMKRTVMLLLIFSLLLPVFPVSRVRAEEPATIEEQIRAFADSIDQSNADDTAAMDLALHGMRGRGKTLTMGPSSALTAALFNSEVLQDGLAKSFEATIRCMQQLDMQAVPGMEMQLNWYGSDNGYSAYILTDEGDPPDNLDWMMSKGQCTGALNSYDKSMEWMVGGASASAVIECIEDSGTVKTYDLTITISDRFDFSTASSSGFKKLLSGIGMLLFQEFDWSCTVSFQLTAPYSYDHCTHSSGAYRWTYDREARTMTSDSSGSYARNNATPMTNTVSDGTVRHYFALDNPIRLYHNKPWVLEYDVRSPKHITFSPVDNAITKTHPQISQNGLHTLQAVSKDYAMAQGDRYYAYNYYSVQLPPLSSGQTVYTFRLENIISSEGSNMIHVTVTNTETGECYVNQLPMDDYSYYGGWMDSTEFISEENRWLSGKDIHINYLGNGIVGFDAEYFDLRIWENGMDGEPESYYRPVASTAPTCLEAGYTDYSCAACGHSKREYDQPATGHHYETALTPPTCTESGFSTYACACGDSYVSDEVPALGHALGDWAEIKAPSCTEKGQEQRNCSRCDYAETQDIPVTGHSYEPTITPPTCTDAGFTTYTCSCGDSYVGDEVPALGHALGAWAEIKAPSCTEKGQERRNCSRCDYAETQDIPVTGHSYEPTITPPTCTDAGFTTYACSCGDSYVGDEVPALGHALGAWAEIKAPSCTEKGQERRNCSRCDYAETQDIPVTGHSYEPTITPPTCTDAGFTTYACSCGDSYVGDEVPALGHALGAWAEIKAPSCTEKGQERRNCSRCDYSETQDIPVTGHSYDAVVTSPTCTDAGFTTYTCSCGDSYVGDEVPALGHALGDWAEIKAPSCTEKGQEQRNCSRCDYAETQDIPVTGHFYEPTVTSPTCTDAGFTTYACSCGDSYVGDEVPALGHDLGEWSEITSPTCTEKGQERRTCSRCDYSETQDIPVTGHSYDAVVTSSTCTEAGFTTYTCACGDSYVDEEVPALGHVWQGMRCSVCGEDRPNPFRDIEEEQWYFEPVLWAVEQGITAGTSTDTFTPNAVCARAQVVTFLWRAFGQPEPKLTINPFADVAEGDYFYKAVLWAVEQGITAGTSDATFSPNIPCTRAQVVTFLWRAMGQPGPEKSDNPFTDVTEGEWFFNPVLWAVENGITAGMSATSFAPGSPCTRAQVVTFLYRTLKDR